MKFLCTKCGKGVVQVQARHTCKASDMETVRGMVEALPRELKGKLALALLREVKEGQGMEIVECEPMVLAYTHFEKR